MSKLVAYFLVGATAVGKSRTAHDIARQCGMEIVSADSMVVYRGMDIGTAKPTHADRKEVRYHGLNLVSPRETFSVSDFRTAALQSLRTIRSENRNAIVVGGTGLYIKALTHGISEHVGPDPELRERLESVIREQGVRPLQDELRKLNPDSYERLKDKSNPRRLIRAIEIARSPDGATPGDWSDSERGPELLGLFMPRAQLHIRIRERVLDMYRRGLADEVSSLLAAGQLGPTAAQAIGYAEAIDFVNGVIGRDEAIEKTVIRTNKLAKRQETWFKHQANVHWLMLNLDTPANDVTETVRRYWETHGGTEVRD